MITILLSDKIDFKIKAITRDKESHYINNKGNNPAKAYNPGVSNSFSLGATSALQLLSKGQL